MHLTIETQFGRYVCYSIEEIYLSFAKSSYFQNLVWNGKRGHPPVVAVQKKHLLMQLDIEKTMENMFEEEPYWYSDHLKNVILEGTFLQIDYQYFVQFLLEIVSNSNNNADVKFIYRIMCH